MERKDKLILIYLASLVPLALAAVFFSLRALDLNRVDSGFLGIAALTVFSSCFLRIQFPRTSIHLTLSDALVIYCMIQYGFALAAFLAIFEALVASLNLRFRGILMKPKTIIINILVAPIAVFTTAKLIGYIFGPLDPLFARHDLTSYIWVFAAAGVGLFAINSIAVALFGSIKTGLPITKVWNENCFDAAIMYLGGALMAGIIYKAIEQFNVYLIISVIAFFALLFLTFRRFVEDVRKTSERAKESERIRAEQAETHVKELVHYVEELERSGAALQESHEKFRHAAYHDALTGLPNRNYFIDKLKDLLSHRREKTELNFAILLLDLNRFKTINDSLGHSMGDRLIQNVARRLSHLVREEDMAARFSGDKFGIILTNLLNKDEATAFAERMSKRIAEPYTLENRQVFTSVKVGIAFGHSRYSEAEDILRDADIAMYHAKDNHESFVIFDQKMHVRAVTRLQLETDLRFAVERNEFELYYQPIIGLQSASLEGFEALVRWNHPQRGLIPPNEFIPITENTGLIIPITIQILNSACRQIAKWQTDSPDGKLLSVAVNLSGKHFAHPQLVSQIKTVLADTGVDPGSLKLELTESAIMENAENAIRMLKEIKRTGVQISIDDFGTGYSSLSYLHRFPIDLLKVDRSFVSEMEKNSENGEIVRTVIALAKALNLKVVAEGIESIHQFHQLRVLGCEYGQGYLFSKPLPVAEIEKLLRDQTRWQHILPADRSRVISPEPDVAHYNTLQ